MEEIKIYGYDELDILFNVVSTGDYIGALGNNTMIHFDKKFAHKDNEVFRYIKSTFGERIYMPRYIGDIVEQPNYYHIGGSSIKNFADECEAKRASRLGVIGRDGRIICVFPMYVSSKSQIIKYPEDLKFKEENNKEYDICTPNGMLLTPDNTYRGDIVAIPKKPPRKDYREDSYTNRFKTELLSGKRAGLMYETEFEISIYDKCDRTITIDGDKYTLQFPEHIFISSEELRIYREFDQYGNSNYTSLKNRMPMCLLLFIRSNGELYVPPLPNIYSTPERICTDVQKYGHILDSVWRTRELSPILPIKEDTLYKRYNQIYDEWRDDPKELLGRVRHECTLFHALGIKTIDELLSKRKEIS